MIRKALVVAVLVILWVAPLPLEPRAHHLVAIFGAVLVAWVSEAVPVAVTALAIGPALVVAGVTDPASAFAPYADPLLFLFVGGFMLAAAMTRHGLDRRFARAASELPFVRGVPWRTHAAIAAAATLASMWISNTATAAIFAPILLGLPHLRRDADAKGPDPATPPLLALAFVCTTAGLGTPVGSPPNLITMRFLAAAGHPLSFVEWMAIGTPAALLLSTAAVLVTIRRTRNDAAGPAPLAPRTPWSRGEIATAICFALAVALWTGPSLAEAAGVPGARAVATLLHPGAVAVLACLPLFAIPDARTSAGAAPEPVLPWGVAVRIDWGVILLFGGGIALGAQLEETGLAASASRGLVALTGPTDVWTLSAVACVGTVLLSEVASNTAAANILVPLVIALARELEVSPVVPALAVGVGASIGFMLPIATGPNALVYATGRVPQRAMIRAGLALDLVCIALVLVLLRTISPAMGWM